MNTPILRTERLILRKFTKEPCIDFLMDITDTDLLSKGSKFSLREGHHRHDFEWLPFERLKDEYFYPLFLKKEIYNLPSAFTIRTERE